MNTAAPENRGRSRRESSRLRYVGYRKPGVVNRTAIMKRRCESLYFYSPAQPDQSPPPRQPRIVLCRLVIVTPAEAICNTALKGCCDTARNRRISSVAPSAFSLWQGSVLQTLSGGSLRSEPPGTCAVRLNQVGFLAFWASLRLGGEKSLALRTVSGLS